jgi:uncharacterized protein YdeI (YjbR/CyaY-like superfamily)
MFQTDPWIDTFISQTKVWKDEYVALRQILLESGLKEEKKWWQPVYTLDGKNIAIIGAFKDFISIGFFKGSLLSDPSHVLVKPGNHTESSRMIKFKNASEIDELSSIITSYILEAIAIEKAGLKIEYTKELEYPDELHQMFHEHPNLKDAFEALTPGRKKGYILFFDAPKQSQTKRSRIEKHIDRIMDGKGLHDE